MNYDTQISFFDVVNLGVLIIDPIWHDPNINDSGMSMIFLTRIEFGSTRSD
jgi:hypothetical protein